MKEKNVLLEVKNLSVNFLGEKQQIQALRDINFQLLPGECLGLVGESGCGKSLTSLAIMGLLPEMARVRDGEINYQGKNLLTLKEREMNKIRGNKISMIFQDPMNSLDPCYQVGDQIAEMILAHENCIKKAAWERAIELMNLVGIPDGKRRLTCYPHQFSGGMCQRVMIAMSLAARPEILIADEPTTALDVTIQAQILSLLKNLSRKLSMSMIFISHDLSVIKKMCHRVGIMYMGEMVEINSIENLFQHPRHPYTKGLLASLPAYQKDCLPKSKLYSIPGTVPSLKDRPLGCQFSPRCFQKQAECEKEIALKNQLRCLFPLEDGINA